MRSRSVALALFSIMFVVARLFGQDMAKVAPEKVKVLLENEKVRVLDILLKPGEKAGMHSHPANAIYFVSGGKVKVTGKDGTATEINPKPGTAGWSEAVTHDNENTGTSDFHAVIVEMKPAKKAKK